MSQTPASSIASSIQTSRPSDRPSSGPIELAVLVSGGGTTLANLISRIADGSLHARIRVVVASRAGLGAEVHAARAGIPYHVVRQRDHADVVSFSETIFKLCDGADLVCCAGWLVLLKIPERWGGRVMNIHPALLPSFGGRGMYGLHVHRAVIEHGCRVSGCTVHYVDDAYDNGPIILQQTCPVFDSDTPESLAARVFAVECRAYPEAIRLHQSGRLTVHARRVTHRPVA